MSRTEEHAGSEAYGFGFAEFLENTPIEEMVDTSQTEEHHGQEVNQDDDPATIEVTELKGMIRLSEAEDSDVEIDNNQSVGGSTSAPKVTQEVGEIAFNLGHEVVEGEKVDAVPHAITTGNKLKRDIEEGKTLFQETLPRSGPLYDEFTKPKALSILQGTGTENTSTRWDLEDVLNVYPSQKLKSLILKKGN